MLSRFYDRELKNWAMNCSLSCSKAKIVHARNLSNHTWASPDRVRGNALHRVDTSTFAMFIHVLYIWTWTIESVFPSYKGMVGILKFFGGMVVEMLVGNGDCVSDKISQTG